MSRRKKPLIAGVVVVGLVAAAVAAVFVNRASRPKPPGLPDTAIIPRAQEMVRAGDKAGATALLRRHLDEHPYDLSSLRMLRQVMPDDAKGELVARLGRTGDPPATFDRLYGEARREGDAAGLRALREWAKANRPDDHKWVCDEIEDMVATKQFAEATELFRGRLTAATADDVRSALMTSFLCTMQAAGRGAEAYSAVPDPHAARAVRVLGKYLEVRVLAGPDAADRDALRALIAAHRGRSPGDPLLWYYEGVAVQGDKEYERAEKVFAEGAAKLPKLDPAADDAPPDHEMFRARRVECFYKLNQPMRAYAEVPPTAATFRQLAAAFQADKRPDDLTKLIAAHKPKFPAAVPYWEAVVLYMQGEYAKAAAAFEAFLATSPPRADERARANEAALRSHLRAGNPAAAKARMDSLPERTVRTPLRAAVLAAAGDAAGLEEILANMMRANASFDPVYSDEDFARAFADPKYDHLRASFPASPPRKK